MKIHEYQAKELLRAHGVPVPRGYPAFTVREAQEAAQKLGGSVWVVKAQIHVADGGRLTDLYPEKPTELGHAVEARLNATDASLSPHAGGYIRYWSRPIEGEIRDDQGISMLNPDTGLFNGDVGVVLARIAPEKAVSTAPQPGKAPRVA